MLARCTRPARIHPRTPGSWVRVAAVVSATVLAGTVAAGCSVVSKVNRIGHSIENNRAAIRTFTANLKNDKTKPFEVTYTATGGAPTVITYAVRPPSDLAFTESAPGSQASATRLIANSSGEYSCSSASASSGWICQKLSKPSAAAQNQLFAIYTPAHWAAFLEAMSIGAGLAGDKVTTSTKNVNGFALKCVNLAGKHSGNSSVCTTAQGILGYVQVASQTTSFQIKSYSASPPDSAFRLPPGAKITR